MTAVQDGPGGVRPRPGLPGRVSVRPRRRTGPRVRPGLVCALCALTLLVLVPGTASPEGVPAGSGAGTDRHGMATPLRMVNLNPFHLLYGVPASAGARVMPARRLGSDRVAGHGIAPAGGRLGHGAGADGR